MRLAFTINSSPVAAQSVQLNRRIGKFYNPLYLKMKEWKRWLAEQMIGDPLQGPLYVSVFYAFQNAKKARDRIEMTNRPDVDNLQKFLFDCCNGVVWEDDKQVTTLFVHKYYDTRPSVRIEVGQYASGGVWEKFYRWKDSFISYMAKIWKEI